MKPHSRDSCPSFIIIREGGVEIMREFRKQIFVCTKENFEGCCATKGAQEVFQAFRNELRSRGITDVLVTGCGCTGQHSTGPTVIIHPDGVWYQQVKPSDVSTIIEFHILNGQVVSELVNPNIVVKK